MGLKHHGEPKDQQVSWGHRGSRPCQEMKGRKAMMGLKVQLEKMVRKGLKHHEEKMVRMAKMGQRVLQERMVRRG